MVLAMLAANGVASAFDHGYADYGRLLQAHVRWIASGHASAVDYDGLKRGRSGAVEIEHLSYDWMLNAQQPGR